jgi:hypothetical protein
MALFTKLPSWASILITVIAAVIVVGLISWGTYTLVKPSPSKLPEGEETVVPKEKPPTTEDEFKDWKTYRNEKYGFEIRYPTHCVVAEQRGIWPYLDIVNLEKCGILIGIANRDYWKGTGPANETRSYWDLGQDIRIGSNLWRKILWKDEFGQEFLWYVIQGNYDYTIICGMAPKEESIEEIVKKNAPYLTQILSTFKFIKQ